MGQLVPLPVAIPLLGAAVLVAVSHFLPKRIPEVAALFVAAGTTVVCALLLVDSADGTIVYWFGGWQPRDGVALGISFTVDPLGAGLALLAAVLVTAVIVFSWHYFDDSGHLFHVLVLVFLAGMCGFALSGDLFNMFVFFELMGVAAYALTGYRIEEAGPLQGALNFAITNSIGGFLVLLGIGLIYGHTGALNLAQIGATLDGERAPGVVLVGFLLVMLGFLVKGAIVPFHFWLADAYAVAPAPVCAIFSGVMVELGLYAVARTYWTAFAGSIGHEEDALRAILVAAGLLTALLGAAMAFLQRHLKRMLAYATISHAGVVLVGIALLDPRGLAGSALTVLAFGLTKASLFLAVGVLLYLRGSTDELRLRGRGRDLPLVAAVFALGIVSLSGLPLLGSYPGHSLIDESAAALGYRWASLAVLAAGIVSTAAIARAAGRVFGGWGAREDRFLSPEPDEHEPEEERARASPALMMGTALALAVAGIGIGLAPGLETLASKAAGRFQDQAAYVATVLHERPSGGLSSSLALPKLRLESVLYGLFTLAGALALAAVGLVRPQLPRSVRTWGGRLAGRPIELLRAAHSGHIGDYVAWLAIGIALFGVAFGAGLR
jgi:multicomponent Na+:H+ antiporter subunit D